jgi:hypothetical protein
MRATKTLTNKIRDLRQWNCDIGRPDLTSRFPQAEHTPEGFFASRPKCMLFLRITLNLKVIAPILINDLPNTDNIICDACLGPTGLEEKGRRFFPFPGGSSDAVYHVHLYIFKKLDSTYRGPSMDNLGRSFGGISQCVVGNVVTATPVTSGMGANFKVTSVMIPRVPSDPVKSPFRL